MGIDVKHRPKLLRPEFSRMVERDNWYLQNKYQELCNYKTIESHGTVSVCMRPYN